MNIFSSIPDILKTIDYTPYINEAVNVVMLTAALFFLFPKCKVPRKYAFIPFYRYFKLSQCADREEDGRPAIFYEILTMMLTAALRISSAIGSKSEMVFTMLVIVCGITGFIYKIRIFFGLCSVFGMKKIWVIPWFIQEWIPLFFMGCLKRYQSTIEVRSRAAGLSNVNTAVLPEGLNIDIKSRKAGSFLKRRTLLKDIHLSIEPGNMVLLLGGSGAGKSTFVNAVTGYEKADAHITLKEKDVYKTYDEVKYEIGLVPQQELMRYNDTIYHTVADSALLRMPIDVGYREREDSISKVLKQFGLDTIRDHIVGLQSGGQKKRISIAMEYISNPFLFVLDEPDSGLDGILARNLMQRLHDISREGKIVIVITHTPDRVVDLFDKVIVLAKDADRTGRLAFYGSIDEARKFFERDTMEDIVRSINLKEEGGDGRADELIEKFEEVRHAAE